MDDKGLKTQNQPPLAGTVQKEKGPVAMGNTGEYIVHSMPELSLPDEVKQAGVENTVSKPEINGIGIAYSGEETPLGIESQERVKLPPLTNEEINEANKQKPSSSIRWLATLLGKLFRRYREK